MALPTAIFSNSKQLCLQEYSKAFSLQDSQVNKQGMQDIENIFHAFTIADFVKNKEATVVVGPKGSGKTWFAQYEVERRACWGSLHAFLSSEYIHQVASRYDREKPIDVSYREWIPLGDLILKFLQQAAIETGCSIVAEKDATDPSLPILLQALKEQEYAIKIIHLTAPEDIRFKAFEKALTAEENQQFYEGAELFASKLSQGYLSTADEVEFYLRNRLDAKPEIAGCWIKTASHPLHGDLKVFDVSKMASIARVQNLALKYLAEKNGEANFVSWKDALDKFY
jgi:hypothetical protein